MSSRGENDYDRQFEADLQKAIALSLETSEYEKFKNEQQKKYADTTECSDSSRKNSIETFPKSRPRPESVVKSNSALLPPPSSSRKNSVNSSVNDLITFNSPKDENKEVIEGFEDLKIQTVNTSDFFAPGLITNQQNSLLFDVNAPSNSNSILPYRPLGFTSFEKPISSEVVNHYMTNYSSVHNPANYGFKAEVTEFFHSFQNKGPKTNIHCYQPQNSGGDNIKNTSVSKNLLKTSFNENEFKKIESNQNCLDVLKVVGKQQNNNLIDLVPFNLSDTKKPNSVEKSSVLQEFDPLLESNSFKNDASATLPEAEVSYNKIKEEERKAVQENYDGSTANIDDDENDDFDDAQSVCSGSFYDPFDPFDYMNTSSVDGSLGEPIYTTVVKVDKSSPLLSRNSITRKSVIEPYVCTYYKIL